MLDAHALHVHELHDPLRCGQVKPPQQMHRFNEPFVQRRGPTQTLLAVRARAVCVLPIVRLVVFLRPIAGSKPTGVLLRHSRRGRAESTIEPAGARRAGRNRHTSVRTNRRAPRSGKPFVVFEPETPGRGHERRRVPNRCCHERRETMPVCTVCGRRFRDPTVRAKRPVIV